MINLTRLSTLSKKQLWHHCHQHHWRPISCFKACRSLLAWWLLLSCCLLASTPLWLDSDSAMVRRWQVGPWSRRLSGWQRPLTQYGDWVGTTVTMITSSKRRRSSCSCYCSSSRPRLLQPKVEPRKPTNLNLIFRPIWQDYIIVTQVTQGLMSTTDLIMSTKRTFQQISIWENLNDATGRRKHHMTAIQHRKLHRPTVKLVVASVSSWLSYFLMLWIQVGDHISFSSFTRFSFLFFWKIWFTTRYNCPAQFSKQGCSNAPMPRT